LTIRDISSEIDPRQDGM